MSTKYAEEDVYTVGQVADLLGCSIRSIYRWEESGAIPQAQRIDRGEVSARVYTQSQVDQIRKMVRERIAFAAIVQERPRRRHRDPNQPIKIVKVKKKPGRIENIGMNPEWAPQIMKALRYVAKHDVAKMELKLTTKDGKTLTF